MAAGDVTVQVVENPTTSSVDTAVTALYVGDNDKWGFVNLGQNLMIIHIEGS
jgi:hypothetical protein